VTEFDAIVVGAGVVGAGIAWELAKAGRRVVVVDKGTAVGAGSTSCSSAIVRFNYSTWTGVVTAWESAHAWAKWGELLGAEQDEHLARFYRTGGLLIDSPAGKPERVYELFDAIGIPYEVWDAATMRERIPPIDAGQHFPPKSVTDEAFWADPHGEVGACYTPDAGFVDDPQLAAQNLMAAALRAGVTLRLRTEVTGVVRADRRVRGVQLSDGSVLEAPVVVNAAGPWSAALNELAGVLDDVTITTRPMRQEVHHVTAPEGVRLGDPCTPFVADPDLGTYFRPTPGDGFLVGGLEPECDPLQWLDDADDFDQTPSATVFEAQVLRVARRVPDLAVPGAPKGLAGAYDVSDDWTPVYDKTSLPGFYVAIGTSGNQFKNAPVIGLLLATLIEAVESGHDHDADPVKVLLPLTGLEADLGSYSRKRTINRDSTFSVLG
jgi:sarcosine oxidase subunit beta